MTALQVETLKLLSEGYTYPEIAEIRGGSRQTVANRVSVIFGKLGACNSSHAVAIGKDRGII